MAVETGPGLAKRTTTASRATPVSTSSFITRRMDSHGYGKNEHASRHPEQIAAALAELRRQGAVVA
jgi:hypothetical protein